MVRPLTVSEMGAGHRHAPGLAFSPVCGDIKGQARLCAWTAEGRGAEAIRCEGLNGAGTDPYSRIRDVCVWHVAPTQRKKRDRMPRRRAGAHPRNRRSANGSDYRRPESCTGDRFAEPRI